MKRWAEVDLPADVFDAYVAARGKPDELDLEGLYLACACARGDEVAIRLFHEHFDADIAVALRRLRVESDQADDVRQSVMAKLFLAKPPKIEQYSGKGSLGYWVRAVAAREALSGQRTAARRGRLLEAAVDAVPDDPELGFLKERYRGEFREAFTAAIEALPDEDRMVLRHRFVDGLTLDQLAAVCGVHRATAARWLARIREALLAGTRVELQSRLRVDRSEFDSIVRLIRSNLEVSVRRLLK